MVNRMRLINRWALMQNTAEENIAEHSQHVAVIAHALCLIGNKNSAKIMTPKDAHCLHSIMMQQKLSPVICPLL